MIVCSSSFEWWFTTVASSSSASSYFWVSVPLASQELQQRLDDLGVLLLAVLLLVGGDRPALAQGRVDLLLLGGRVGDEHLGQRVAGGLAVGVVASGQAQQVLEEAVVLQDPLQHVAARRSGDVDLAHRPIMAEQHA